MAQYISKSDLVAEIKRISCENPMDNSWYVDTEELLDFLDTLEVKEVDLDEEADNYWETLTSDVKNCIFFNDFYKIAKHFFELGMHVSNKAQKGEEV